MHIPFGLDEARSAVVTAVGILSIAFIPLVLLRRKDPPTAIAWILVLVFLPVVGVCLFWFLGRDRVRRPARRKVSANIILRGRMISLTDAVNEAEVEADLEGQPAEQKGVMRLAAKMRNARLLGGNHVDILVGAPDTYASIIEHIELAQHHVHMEYYIFLHDAQGIPILEALTRAAQRGVRVRLLCDAFGSRSLRGPALDALKRAGGEVARFFPLDPVRRAWTINLRNHRKLTVIDGNVGFTGGINIGDLFVPWRDVHLSVRGPVVAELQTTFLEDWYFATGKDIAQADLFHFDVAAGHSVMQIVDSGPDGTVESIHRLYFAAIVSARNRVYITTPYFVPDRAILVALQTAALRGVEVRLLLPARSNHLVTFHAGRSFYDELLNAGVQVHEYHRGMLHTKTIVVDGRFATVGTANLDVRSFRLNFETIAVLYDPDTVGRLERIFLEDLGYTHMVELEEWRRRSVSTRVAEGFGRLCSPLL